MRFLFFSFLLVMGCGTPLKGTATFDTSPAQALDEVDEADTEEEDTDDSPVDPPDTDEEEEEPVYEFHLQVVPEQATFGPVAVGETATETLTIKNIGTEAIHINAMGVSDTSIFEYRSLPSPPITLSPGQEQTVQIDFTPSESREYEAELTIITAEVLHESANTNLRGRGDAGDCEICEPIIDVSDDSISLDALLTCSATETITVRNIGDRPLRISATNVVNDSLFSCGTFSVPPLGGAIVLDEMESHAITVTFTATRECLEYFTLSSEENTLHILSNDSSNPDTVVQLEGLALCLF